MKAERENEKCPKREIDFERERDKRLAEAHETALKYLTYGMRTEAQVEKRLEERNFTAREIGETISYLKEMRYLDDAEYAAVYIRYAKQKKHGKNRIIRELRNRGVDESDIEDAFYREEREQEESGAELMTEAERAEEEALRIADGKPVDDKLIAKVGRRLKTLGYEADAIYHAVGVVMRMKQRGDDDFE